MTDLTKKPCACGGEMGQIIGFETLHDSEDRIPVRKGWYCVDCRAWEEAILRERTVENI
jgi:hypothetical protein